MTQEQKQAIWAAGWLAKGHLTHALWHLTREDGTTGDYSDTELIQYAKKKGMELPAELTGVEADVIERTGLVILPKHWIGIPLKVEMGVKRLRIKPAEPLPEPPKETTE